MAEKQEAPEAGEPAPSPVDDPGARWLVVTLMLASVNNIRYGLMLLGDPPETADRLGKLLARRVQQAFERGGNDAP
jgi:hypothetical protein